jgi:hypothetical protein
MLQAAMTSWQKLAQRCLERPPLDVVVVTQEHGVSLMIWQRDPSGCRARSTFLVDLWPDDGSQRRARAVREAEAVRVALLDPLHLNLRAIGAWEP